MTGVELRLSDKAETYNFCNITYMCNHTLGDIFTGNEIRGFLEKIPIS